MPRLAPGRVPPPGNRPLLLLIGALVVMAVAVSLAWQILSPAQPVQLVGGVLTSAASDNPAAVVDAIFFVLAGAAGLLVGLAAAALPGGQAGRLSVTAVLGGLLASVLAWRLGVLLGPPALLAQQESGVEQLVTPVALSSPLTVIVWPAATAAALFVGLLVSLVVRPPHGD